MIGGFKYLRWLRGHGHGFLKITLVWHQIENKDSIYRLWRKMSA